ncbi:MAG: division/cell wall cluster transcriptional repressor MraZ [Pirellulales bacterium]
MANDIELILGEHPRLLDERYRVSLPPELVEPLTTDGIECVLAKERPGCLSLWNKPQWQPALDQGIDLVRGKIRAGRMEGRLAQVQLLGRLLSTRHKDVKIAGRGRLLIPEGFREFLGVEKGQEVIVVGAAMCVEIWKPETWFSYLEKRIPRFRQLFEKLSG